MPPTPPKKKPVLECGDLPLASARSDVIRRSCVLPSQTQGAAFLPEPRSPPGRILPSRTWCGAGASRNAGLLPNASAMSAASPAIPSAGARARSTPMCHRLPQHPPADLCLKGRSRGGRVPSGSTTAGSCAPGRVFPSLSPSRSRLLTSLRLDVPRPHPPSYRHPIFLAVGQPRWASRKARWGDSPLIRSRRPPLQRFPDGGSARWRLIRKGSFG